MIRGIVRIALITIVASCTLTDQKTKIVEDQEKEIITTPPSIDTTPKVTGIGGVFFYTENAQATKDWYTKNLGLEINEWGSTSFESRDLNNPDEVNSLQWTPFKTGDDYFAPSKKEFMINYRVQNLDGLLANLTANGVTILDSVATYDYGKFVHIMDVDGNKIELWEPINND